MGEALIGLLGVIVGALLSGGVTWWQTRRASAAERRAAARLVEAALRLAAGRLQWLRATLMPETLGEVSPADRREALALLADSPAPTAWSEHRHLLAKTLDSDDWYSVAHAYEALETLRSPVTAEASTQDRSGADIPSSRRRWTATCSRCGRRRCWAEPRPRAHWPGGANRPGGEEPGGFYDEMVGSLRGTTAALPPALREDAPPSDA